MRPQQPCKTSHLKRITQEFKPTGYTETLLKIFWAMYEKLGSQHWWPGETPFEISIGAILTQNTSWKNVEKAIDNLKSKNLLDPFKLFQLEDYKLANLIRPAGYYNIKTVRLKNFLKFLINGYNGDLNNLAREELYVARKKLLEVKGIGPETGDSILLYALNQPSFVVDAYTIRILSRHDIILEDMDYHDVRDLFMSNLPNDSCLFNEYHALFVKIGKDFCKKKTPLCSSCPLKEY